MGFHLRITHKIAAIGAVGIVGLVAVGGIYLAGGAVQERYRLAAADARTIASLTDRLFIHMLESRRAEKDFLLRSTDQYAQRHGAVTKSIESDFEALQRQVRGASFAELDAKVGAIRAGFETYRKHFGAVVDLRRKLGLDENSGLEGTLRKSVHEIESALKQFDEPRLAVTMLMMRRHVKDFMLRRTARYGDDMKKRAGEFTAGLAAASAIPAGAKNDIAQKLAAYQRDFFEWMDTAQSLARELKATSDAYARIEPLVSAVQEMVENARNESESADGASRAATGQQMQIAIVLVILGVAMLALLIGRAIARPLSAMTRAMRQLADGDFAVMLPGLGRKDEIGDMAGAVEEFKVKAVEKAEREMQEKQAEALRAAAQRKAEMQKLADEFQTAVGGIVDAVSSASTELEAAAGTLTRTAEVTQELSGTVAAASEQASSNVQSVASATEEMTSSVNEISRQVQESARIAGEAVKQAEKTDSRIGELSQAASRIGDVVKLITAIAEQTNLLALNATIEAARAG